MAEPIIIRKNFSIGQIAAEADDEFLFNCFLDHPALAEIREPKSPKMVLLGSTGIGKTAFLRMINKQEERCHSVELGELSLSYISNSDVINFLLALDVPLDRFFQALWKHVICIEYIKLRFGVDSESKSQNFWDRIRDRFQNQSAKRKALDYLEKWERKFWVSFDEAIKEITQNLESQISANFSAEIKKFSSDAGYQRKLGVERKSHLQQRLKRFVDADLLSELAQVINLLSEYDSNHQATSYVLIDRLDEDWVSGGIKYQLIRSLIEALKNLRRISDLKVIVALRSDVMERVIHETKEKGFQSEKYEDYVLRIRWDNEQIKKLVNKRINYLFRYKYTGASVFFEDIFVEQINKDKTINYILDRTMLRPRDAINFINVCLDEAAGKPKVGKGNVTRAESIYSENRLSALIDEWRPIFPAVEPMILQLKGRPEHFEIASFYTTDTLDRLFSAIFEHEAYLKDDVAGMVEKAINESGDSMLRVIVSRMFERLFLMGAIGLKTSSESPFQWFYKTQRRISSSSMDSTSKVRIHPMLYSSLAIIR